MAVAIAVRARLFARLRELAGTDGENVEVRAGATVDDVYGALRKLHPALNPNREAVRAAVNQQFAEWDAIVADGDEVAFIPPVSGGLASPPRGEVPRSGGGETQVANVRW